MPITEPFEADERPAVAPADEPLVVDLEGYEGPLDVLLALARNQKVDLAKISILGLAEQYLAFIAEARRISIEIAADYLVMAAWLAYLKSRLLLPEEEDDEPSGPEMAARLAFQLRRLDAMREAAKKLMARDRLGREIFPRGAPEGIRIIRRPVFEMALFDLLKSYGDIKIRGHARPMVIVLPNVHTYEAALERFASMLGRVPSWQSLQAFLPANLLTGEERRIAMASTFSAGLELARRGTLKLRQRKPFGPIYVMANDSSSEEE